MKKRVIVAVILLALIVITCVGCNFKQDKKYSLIYDKKYYRADYLYPNSLANNQRWIVFYKDGTGAWQGDGYGKYGTIKFRYILTDDTVHCFFDGGLKQTLEGSTWNRWFYIGDGILYTEYTPTSTQYLNEEKIDLFPNFGR